MNDYYVYSYIRETDSKNGSVDSPYYIGKGIGKRAWKSWRRVKPNKTKTNIKILAENLSEIDALQSEMLFIYLHGRIDLGTGCLHNLTDGGELGGINRSKKIFEKSAKSNIGKHNYSLKTRQLISKNRSGKGIGKDNGMYGKSHSQQSLEKMSLNKRGKI